MTFEQYLALVIGVLGVIGFFGSPFFKNAAAMTGFVHYIYLFPWKLMGSHFGWTTTTIEAEIPVIISVVILLLAISWPQLRSSWSTEPARQDED